VTTTTAGRFTATSPCDELAQRGKVTDTGTDPECVWCRDGAENQILPSRHPTEDVDARVDCDRVVRL